MTDHVDATNELLAIKQALAGDRPLVALSKATHLARSQPASDLLADIRILEGEALMRVGRLPEAILVLDDLIRRAPLSEHVGAALLLKGRCLAIQAKREDDTPLYEQALRSYRHAALSNRSSAKVVKEAVKGVRRCLAAAGYSSQAADRYITEMLKWIEEGDAQSEQTPSEGITH